MPSFECLSIVRDGSLYVVLLRSSTERASRVALSALGVVVAVVAGSVPAGIMDRVNGSGVLVGASSAIIGTTVVAPIVLVYLVAKQLAGTEEAGRLRDLYLQGVSISLLRMGALLAALRDWLWMSLVAGLAGSLIGFSDGIRATGMGSLWGNWLGSPIAIIAVDAYVFSLGVLWATVFRNALFALLFGTVAPILSLALIPLADSSWSLAIVRIGPLAPLWSAASSPGFGRYDLAMSSVSQYVTLVGWSVAAVLGGWLASRQNRAALG